MLSVEELQKINGGKGKHKGLIKDNFMVVYRRAVEVNQVKADKLKDSGPIRRLITISRRPGRLVEPSRPLIVLYIRTFIPTIYIYLYILHSILNKASIKTTLVFS